MSKTTWSPAKVLVVIFGSIGVAYVAWVVFVTGVVMFMGSKEAAEKDQVQLEVHLRTDPACSGPNEVSLHIANRSKRELRAMRFSFSIYEDGHSSNLAPSSMNFIASDRIVGPGLTEAECYLVPAELKARRGTTWTAQVHTVEFAKN